MVSYRVPGSSGIETDYKCKFIDQVTALSAVKYYKENDLHLLVYCWHVSFISHKWRINFKAFFLEFFLCSDCSEKNGRYYID